MDNNVLNGKCFKFCVVLLWCLFVSTINICMAQTKLINRQKGKIILENEYLSLAFADGDEFRFLELSSPKNNLAWLPDGGDFNHLWELTIKGPNGINPEVKPMNCRYVGTSFEENDVNASVSFLWEMRLNKNHYYPVRVIVSLSRESGLSEWKIEADLPERWMVTKSDFPRILVKQQSMSKLIMPAGWGVEYTLDSFSEYSAQYPSCTGSMQLLCIHNKDAGSFYYATHDKDACIKKFKVKNRGVFSSVSTEVVASENWTSASGGTFSMPFTTSIGIDNNGWESAVVNWYRPFTFETVWGNKTFETRELPQWVLDADMWLRPHFTTEETWKWLKAGLDFFGSQTACHWYRWHQIEYDVDYPEYFPAKENLKDQMQEAQKMGSHVIPYINGRLWDPQSTSYLEKNGAQHSCRKADGTLYTEIYGSMIPNSVTCPSSKVWQDIIINLTTRIQNELSSDGIYIDQIGAAPGVPCWNAEHDHPTGGGSFWHLSYRTLLENVRKGLLPGNIIITEENAECFMDLFDIMLMVNTPQSEDVNIVPLYPLVYSDRMMLNCYLYYPLSENVNSMAFRLKNVLGLLWGAQLGWIKPELIMAPEAREEAEFLRKLVSFRKEQHDLIYGGRFIKEITPIGDNPVLYIPGMYNSHAVRGACWVGANGNEAMLLINMDNIPHRIILPDKTERQIGSKECLRINL